MSTVRRSKTDLDDAKLLADLANAPTHTDPEIDAMAVADDSVWTEDDLATANRVYPVQTPEVALRPRLDPAARHRIRTRSGTAGATTPLERIHPDHTGENTL
jgi:hypothetical protein